MTFSPLTNRTISTSQHGPRSRGIDHIILHHAASGNLNGVLDMIARATRRVSYNYVIGPDGTIVGVVNEDRRSWSVANEPWDSRSVTICAINSSVGGAWPVSDATHNAMGRLVADIAARRRIPVNRERIFGHGELWTRHRAGYATACPGGLNMDRVVNLAQSGGGADASREESDMRIISVPHGTIALVGEFTGHAFTSMNFSTGSNMATFPQTGGLTQDQVTTLLNEANARRAALVREVSVAVLSALDPAAAARFAEANPEPDEDEDEGEVIGE